MLSYAQGDAAKLSEVTQARQEAGDRLEEHNRRLRQYGLITLVFLAGATVVNFTADNDLARSLALVPALLSLATMVWVKERRVKWRVRYDMAEARRDHLREQLNDPQG